MPYPSLPGHRPPEEIQPPAALGSSAPQPKRTSGQRPKPPSSTHDYAGADTSGQSVKAPPSSAPRTTLQSAKGRRSAKIHSWDHSKGYGFLNHGKSRLFLHRRDFAEHHKKPMPGDLIHFYEGHDAQGRPCAVQACHHNDGGRLRGSHLLLLIALTILPGLDLYKLGSLIPLQSTALRPIIPYFVVSVISLITYLRYARDKRSARAKTWRIPESQLHFLSLVGGWPGAFLAQRKLRHKCAKTGFLLFFWLTIIAHQYLAIDYLCRWQITRAILTKLTGLG